MPYSDIQNARKVAAQAASLTEQLTYQGLADGIVFTLDNTMTFGVNLELVSAARATDDTRVIIRDRIVRAIQGALPTGAIIRTYSETRPTTYAALARSAPQPRMGSPLEQMLRANHNVLERMRKTGWVSEASTYMTVTLPIPGRVKKRPYTTAELRPLIERATSLRGRIVRQLTLGGMTATPMTDAAIWNRIYDYFNPSSAGSEPPPYQQNLDGADLGAVRVLRFMKRRQPNRLPHVPTMRAQVACSDIDLDYDACFMNGHTRVGIVSFLKPSRSSTPDCTEQIIQALGGTHSSFIVEYLVVDAPKIRAQINESLDKQETAASDPTMKAGREVFSRIAQGTHVVQALEMGQVITEMSMHAVSFARTQDELDDRRERALAAFSAVGGCMPRIASSGTGIELYLENAPFNGQRSKYQSGAYYQNVVDCIPKVGPWSGNEHGVLPLRSRSGQVFSISPVGQKNAGVVVTASAGSGKSVAVSQLAAGLVHKYDASLTIVDPKRDYLALFLLLGAQNAVVSISPGAMLPTGQQVMINPFDLPEGQGTPTAEKLDFLFELFAALRVFDHSAYRRSIFQEGIQNFYYRYADQQPDGTTIYTGQRGFLTQFADVIARLNTVGDLPVQDNPALRSEIGNVANELRAFCGDTPIGSLLDGPTTVDLTSRYLYLDISGMFGSDQLRQLGVLLTNELVWQRTAKLEGKAVIVMEEGGVAAELPGIVKLTNRLFMTGRSLGIIPILVIQNIDSALAYKAVINNASTRILLASAPSERAAIADVYDLNPAMRRLHASLSGEAGRYSELLVLQDAHGGMNGDVGQLWLSREAYWMTTSVDTEAQARKRLAAELYGGDEAQAALHLAQEERHAPSPHRAA